MARTENLTILFIDMVGYTERTSAQSRDETGLLLYNFNRLLLPQITGFGSRLIKPLGDALLAAFRSPTDAVRCGMAIQDALAEYNNLQPDNRRIHVRIGINTGEVRVERNDIFGEAVNIASRVQNMTPVNEIYLTGVVYLSMNKAEVPTEHVGEFTLKGIPELVRIFQVRPSTIARLVPVHESLENVPGELPFGGMNHLLADRSLYTRANAALSVVSMTDATQWIRYAPRRKIFNALAAIALMAGGIFAATRDWSRPMQLPGMAAPAAVPDYAIKSVRAQEVLRHAHAVYALGRKRDAAVEYARALELDPSYQNDPVVATNLIGALNAAKGTVPDTIRKYPSATIIEALRHRTGQPGHNGGQLAAQMLIELGKGNLIDKAGLAIVEFNEGASCEERLAAVKRLRALKDRRALPVLNEAISGMKSLFKNNCLSNEAKSAIQEIEQKTGS